MDDIHEGKEKKGNFYRPNEWQIYRIAEAKSQIRY
jgi:hypothetical protein